MEAALVEVETSLETFPEERALYDTQINLLAQLERVDELEATLLDMIERFPGDPQLVGSLVRVYVANDDIASGEAFLRSRAEGGDPETAAVRRVDLVRFQLDLNGPEAALVELDRMIETTPDVTLRGLRAQIRFNQGDQQEAIAELEDVLEGAEGNLETDEIRVILARMLEQTGNRVGAQRLIEQVLERDSTQVSALKMDANWKIEGDNPDAAISLLRTALDQTPDDFEAMTLMAEAHARNGNRDLSRDMLALAFEASGSGSSEAQRYAAALTEDGRLASAEEVLQEALRARPGDVGLMVNLADLHIRDGDWGKAQQIEAQLRRVATDRANRAADAIEASRLTSEGRTDEAVAFLENLASENSDDIAARIAVVRTRLLAQDIEGALSYAADLRAENPESVPLALIEAATLSSAGQPEAAAAIYTEVVERTPQVQGAWMGLVRARLAQGDRDGARAAMDQGLEAMPDAMDLLWIKASFLEQAGDQAGALDVYAALYERAPNSAVIANNYASLLSVLQSDDAEMLERAHAVARRLRGTEEPAFQDTYGWISYLRGDYEVALEHLEPAAAGLSQDPLVQYHLGATYAALGRSDEAAAQFDKALAMMEDGTHPQIERVQAARAALDASAAAEGETDDG
jgi:tetratricopeptide (TPR) repeat protein